MYIYIYMCICIYIYILKRWLSNLRSLVRVPVSRVFPCGCRMQTHKHKYIYTYRRLHGRALGGEEQILCPEGLVRRPESKETGPYSSPKYTPHIYMNPLGAGCLVPESRSQTSFTGAYHHNGDLSLRLALYRLRSSLAAC